MNQCKPPCTVITRPNSSTWQGQTFFKEPRHRDVGRVVSYFAVQIQRLAWRTECSHSNVSATSKAIDDHKHRRSVAEEARTGHMHSSREAQAQTI